MDNIVIIIAVVAFFLFSTYSNYKKEQEKANTRDPSKPQNRPTTSDSSPHEVPHPIEIPKWLEDFLPPQERVERKSRPEPIAIPAPVDLTTHQGSIDYKPVKYERVKYVPSELPADLLKEYRALPEKREIEELKRSVAIHASHSHQFKRLQPFLLVDKVEEEIEVPVFDLREAIIMNAILERPYR